MNRNLEIEQRISKRDNLRKHGGNPYGGMGMDGISEAEKKLRYEEMAYIKNHPEIYRPHKRVEEDRSMYLITPY